MFERFAADARDTVVGAQEVARTRGDDAIDAAHLLLSLARQDDGAGAAALASVGVDGLERQVDSARRHDTLDGPALAALGIDLDEIRARTDAAFGPGALDRAGDDERTRGRRTRRSHIPFTPEAKKALELSLREAVHAGSRAIDSGHVLAAVARAKGSTAHRALVDALTAAGSDVAGLRVALATQHRKAS
ncbi:Clp protease N-terminal domain-containing protein [Cellulosimicrobium sp. SH8]|uniref:Clp protease N-terminal domain-containing protein n=1 Tax=Cellulosimicrobium sp. SH8 TaxID=2952936 RepID=UPI0021F35F69|nr:Clp protease N-terminal domain-containing protein [Cellulosimicrobium sp. SH8]